MKMSRIRRFFAGRRLQQQVSQPPLQANMFHGARTITINGGIFNMISVVISKFSSSPHSITMCIQIVPSIDAGNPTPNPPQESSSATTGTTGSRTNGNDEESPGVAT